MTSLLSHWTERDDLAGPVIVFSASGGMVLLTALGVWASLGKLLAIAWFAFGAMVGGAWLGVQSERRSPGETEAQGRRLVWAYGLSSGAMIMSTTLFLIPKAMSHHAAFGGVGIAMGIVLGFAIHTMHVGRTRSDGSVLPVVWELSLHSFGAGLVIGAVYATMPALGPTLGVAIVSHKAPAGYAAARRLRRHGRSGGMLLLPAAAVGLAALPVGLVELPAQDVLHALVFGGATGIFLHVALDFLPRCDWSRGLDSVSDSGSCVRAESDENCTDGMRWQAIGSTFLGGALIVIIWSML